MELTKRLSIRPTWGFEKFRLPDGSPTDAAGELEFHRTKKRAKYVRLSNDTPNNKLHDLLTKQWKLKPPPIIISVTGGAKDFKMRTRLTKEFQKSLVQAAESTGAWIITGGTHTGVMKHVGNAIKKHNTIKSRRVVTLGIATWGIVRKRDTLQRTNYEVGPIPYNCEEFDTLNRHHTHFILVDDGSVGEFGKEIELRARLEKHIAEKNKDVQVVCVIVQGGPGSLATVYNALQHGTPVVVVGDSGGWANILSVLCNENFNNVAEDTVLRLMKENGSNIPNEAEVSRLTNMARECVKMKHLITVFSLNQTEDRDLDHAILQSILNANICKDQQTEISKDQQTETHLRLALAWNRADIAETDILTEDSYVKDTAITEIFIDALKQDKPGFVQVLLDYDLRLHNAFTDDHLFGLYRSSILTRSTNDPSREIKKKKDAYMGPRCRFEIENFQEKKMQGVLRELFIWSILSNKKECARVLWNALNEEIFSAAIVASSLLKSMSKRSESKDEKEDLLAHAEEYKLISYGILSECFAKDADKTSLVLKRRMTHWGKQTCLEVAVNAKEMHIVSHPAVQLLLDNIWFGFIKKPQHSLRIVFLTVCIYIGAFLPFLIPLIISFERTKTNKVGVISSEEGSFDGNNTVGEADELSTFLGSCETSFKKRSEEKLAKERSVLKKITCFYQAPVVKFHLTVLFYLIFLILFGYVLLFNFFDTINEFEYALIAWVVALFLEEVRQLCDSRIKGVRAKLIHYLKSLGNLLDLLSFTLFIVGLVLRILHMNMSVELLQAARVLFCFAFVVFSLRLLSMFTVNEQLGPKLLMVRKMLKDLFFFLFILAVFLIAYGVASQSLLYPNEGSAGVVFAGILSKPYWNIFGELFLPEIAYNPTTDEFACTNDVSLTAQGSRRCPEQNVIVPIISALYLLLANVLLLNLLIAMFSYTFSKLVDRTDTIWKYQRHSLIKEYSMRPWLVAPLSFIPFLLSFFSSSCGRKKNDEEDAAFEKIFTPKESDMEDSLMAWVRDNAEAYMESLKQEERESVSFRVRGVTEKLDTLSSTVNTVQENLENQRAVTAKVECLETKMDACYQSLQWIISALINKEFLPESVPGKIHTNARSSIYPRSNIKRLPILDHMVPWNIPLSYHPPSHTDPKILKRPLPPYADKEEGYADLPYNEFDEELHVDRRSRHVGKYNVVDGLPRNPMGRTGLAGRGLLGRFGPNHAADPIVTRWLKDEHGNKVEEGGKPVLEFVAIKRGDTGDWAIPGGMVDPGENVTLTLKREFNEEVDASGGASGDEAQEQKNKIEEFLSSKAIEIFHGYCDDYRNTDNAWIETIACNFHDEDGSVFESIKLSAGDGVVKAKWKKIDDSLKLFADHKKYLEKVANLHKAHFRNE